MYERLGRLLKFNLSIYHHYSLRPVFYAHTFPEHALLLIELNPSPFAYLFSFSFPSLTVSKRKLYSVFRLL